MRSITNPSYYRSDGYRTVVKLVSSTHTITEANIVMGGFVYDSRMVEGESFQVGTAIADEIRISLDNSSGIYNKTFLGKEFTVSIAYKRNGTQGSWYQLGIFYVTEVDESNAQITNMVLQDKMILFDQVIPSFMVATAYANLQAFCSTLNTELVNSSHELDCLQKFTVFAAGNENGITYRDFVRGCALLSGTNAHIDNTGRLVFRGITTTSTSINATVRYSSRLGERSRVGGVEVIDDEGTTIFSRSIHDDDTSRVTISSEASVIVDLVGGITTIGEVYSGIVSAGNANYYPKSFNYSAYYYPCEMTSMVYWEVEPGDTINYVDKNNTTYSTIVTSCASILNGNSSITSVADGERRDVPSLLDAIRSANASLRETADNAQSTATGAASTASSAASAASAAQTAADNAQDRADDAYDLAEDAMDAASDAEKVATNYLTFSQQNGLDVGYANTQAKTRISGSGVEIFDGNGTSMEYIGRQNNQPYARIGYTSQGYMETSNGGLDLKFNGNEIAHMGWGETNADPFWGGGQPGTTEMAPYYTFGDRADSYEDNDLDEHQAYIGQNSFVPGKMGVAIGPWTLVGGYGNVATDQFQTVVGQWNDPDEPGLFVVGAGSHPSHGQRSNALVVGGVGHAVMIHGNTYIDGGLTAAPQSISVNRQTVSGITLESSGLRVYTSAGWCAVTIELTSTTTLSDWTTIASNMPIPVTNWYDTMESWATTYKRPFRVQVNASSGNLNLRYGDSSSYRISFVYPIAT